MTTIQLKDIKLSTEMLDANQISSTVVIKNSALSSPSLLICDLSTTNDQPDAKTYVSCALTYGQFEPYPDEYVGEFTVEQMNSQSIEKMKRYTVVDSGFLNSVLSVDANDYVMWIDNKWVKLPFYNNIKGAKTVSEINLSSFDTFTEGVAFLITDTGLLNDQLDVLSGMTVYQTNEGRWNIRTINALTYSDGSTVIGNGIAVGERSIALRGGYAKGYKSFANGINDLAYGSHAKSEGGSAYGYGSHTEGLGITLLSAMASHAEGDSVAANQYAHAEGGKTFAGGQWTHSEGRETVALNYASHAEGYQTSAIGGYSHAEGSKSIASGSFSHANGIRTLASGTGSYAVGNQTSATGYYGYAVGEKTLAAGSYSFAIGQKVNAHDLGCIGLGISQELSNGAIGIGQNLSANGRYSIALGNNVSVDVDDSGSFTWNRTEALYTSKGSGTFAINPRNGTAGFYIGISSLNDYLKTIDTKEQGKKIETLSDDVNTLKRQVASVVTVSTDISCLSSELSTHTKQITDISDNIDIVSSDISEISVQQSINALSISNINNNAIQLYEQTSNNLTPNFKDIEFIYDGETKKTGYFAKDSTTNKVVINSSTGYNLAYYEVQAGNTYTVLGVFNGYYVDTDKETILSTMSLTESTNFRSTIVADRDGYFALTIYKDKNNNNGQVHICDGDSIIPQLSSIKDKSYEKLINWSNNALLSVNVRNAACNATIFKEHAYVTLVGKSYAILTGNSYTTLELELDPNSTYRFRSVHCGVLLADDKALAVGSFITTGQSSYVLSSDTIQSTNAKYLLYSIGTSDDYDIKHSYQIAKDCQLSDIEGVEVGELADSTVIKGINEIAYQTELGKENNVKYTSYNLFDSATLISNNGYAVGSKYLGYNIKDGSSYATYMIIVEPNAKYSFSKKVRWVYGLGYNKRNITQTFSTYITEITTDSNTRYVLLSDSKTQFTDLKISKGEVSDITSEKTISGIKPLPQMITDIAELKAKTADLEVDNRKHFEKLNADLLGTNQTLALSNANSVKNYQIYSTGFRIPNENVDISVGLSSETSIENTIVLDELSVQYIANDSAKCFTQLHNLQLSNNIQMTLEVSCHSSPTTPYDNNAKFTLYSNGNKYEKMLRFDKNNSEVMYLKNGSDELSNISMSWMSNNLKKPIWIFGDSYISEFTSRWTYYFDRAGYNKNVLFNGYAGSAGAQGIKDLKNLLKFATPKFVLWCNGMNDGNDSNDTTPSNAYQANINELMELAERYSFKVVFTTIPSTPIINNKGKNYWIRNTSNCQYVDFEKAVGADISNQWFDGLREQTGTGTHTTVEGAKVLYAQLLIDFPEVTMN